ncbi:hypothetical protein C8Q76DRAFT_451607 [Earliella scabrosa]|nr:hypothetical protein C8Q76DRAFT_451607 [Earliella scabrosa]
MEAITGEASQLSKESLAPDDSAPTAERLAQVYKQPTPTISSPHAAVSPHPTPAFVLSQDLDSAASRPLVDPCRALHDHMLVSRTALRIVLAHLQEADHRRSHTDELLAIERPEPLDTTTKQSLPCSASLSLNVYQQDTREHPPPPGESLSSLCIPTENIAQAVFEDLSHHDPISTCHLPGQPHDVQQGQPPRARAREAAGTTAHSRDMANLARLQPRTPALLRTADGPVFSWEELMRTAHRCACTDGLTDDLRPPDI